MSVFGSINVVISAAIGGLAGSLQAALSALGKFSKSVLAALNPVRLLGSVLKSTFGQLALFSGADAIVSSLRQMAGASAENVDSMSKLGRRLGTTYAELAAIEHAGALAGVGIDQIANAMTKSDVAMQKAASGSKAAQAAFATLGLNVAQLQGMDAAERFEAISTAIASLPTEAERAAAAVALFGRSGAQMLPMFEGGADAIRRAREEAERFGLALTDTQAQSVENMNDAFTRAYRAIEGVVTQVVANLAPAVEALTTSFVEMIGSVGGTTIGQTIADALMQGAIFLADTIDWIVPYFTAAWEGLANVAAMLQVPFDIAYSAGQLFVGVAKTLQTVFAAATNSIVSIAKTLVGAAAFLAEQIPGMGGIAKRLRDTESGLQKTQNKLSASTKASAKDAAEAFSNAWNGAQADATEQVPGMLGSMMRDAAESMRANRRNAERSTTTDRVVTTTKPLVAQINSSELKAIVAGTSAGESFRNSLLRGADPRLDGDAAKETANNTERTADAVEDLAGELAGVGGLGLATISV